MSEQLNIMDYQPDPEDIIDSAAQEVATKDHVEEGETGTAIVLAQNLVPADVFVKDTVHIDAILDQIKSQVKSEVFDISTEKGRTRIRSIARQIGGAKNDLKKMAQGLTEGWKEQTKIVTTETSKMEKKFDAFRDEHLAPLTAWQARQDEMEADIKIIEDLCCFEPQTEITIDLVTFRIDSIAAYDGKDWGDFAARAEYAKRTSLEKLELLLADITRREEERVELERLRKAEADRLQKERDDKIAAEAAAEADRKAKEKADADAKALADKVEADRIEAERQHQQSLADAKAERDRIQKEKDDAAAALEKEKADRVAALKKAEEDRLAAVQAEKDRVAAEKKKADDEAAAREADLEHKRKINNEALSVLQGIVDELSEQGKTSEFISKEILSWIAQGKVPHVKITY